MEDVLLNTELRGIRLFKKGKVRDLYDLGDKLLIIATDRISAFDVILQEGIPQKGKILTALSEFWFNYTKDFIPNHFITADVNQYPEKLKKFASLLEKRSMLVKKTKSIKVECVVRGYLSGSAWKEYQKKGTVCGIKLPSGLKESERLSQPIFTPATKASEGHDINISEEEMKKMIGEEITRALKEKSLAIYNRAGKYVEEKGLIISDTKLEFGIYDHKIMLIDELLTPDSSRFWPQEDYEPGKPQKSFDKQFVRDYLESINWDKKPPAPHLPPEIIRKTSEKYLESYKKIVA